MFGAPDMVEPDHVKASGDGKSMIAKGIKFLAADPQNVFSMEIAHKPPTEMAGLTHKASIPVAREVLFETQAQTLSSAFNGQHRI